MASKSVVETTLRITGTWSTSTRVEVVTVWVDAEIVAKPLPMAVSSPVPVDGGHAKVAGGPRHLHSFDHMSIRVQHFGGEPWGARVSACRGEPEEQERQDAVRRTLGFSGSSAAAVSNPGGALVAPPALLTGSPAS